MKIISNQAFYTLALILNCGRKYQMRKTQMSTMLTALAKNLSGGLTLVRFVNEVKAE